MLITNKPGITIPIYKKEDIIPTLKKIIFDKDYQNELEEKRKQYSTEGKATEKVTNLIYKVLKI